jgi:tRNA dimethylallyltransferase
MMPKLLCIVGPTATGKTSLAQKLSQFQPSILISADSRQVYRGMDIVTGKDHPQDVKIIGIDLLNPGDDNSVAIWYDKVYPLILLAWDNGVLPIVVGGTGLYVKALTHGIATMSVPINDSLRQDLNNLSLIELQERLIKLDKSKFEDMNNSDRHNQRRLIRAIEVASTTTQNTHKSSTIIPQSKLIGLYYSDLSMQQSQIRQRVIKRLEEGALAETKRLAQSASPQALSAIGYRSIISYLDGSLSYEQMVENWTTDEISYAKRQLTWFRAQDVTWYDRGIIDIKEIKI